MWEQMYSFLKSWFIYQDAGAKIVLVSIVLALAFAAIWLFFHWPPLFRRHWLWAVGVCSAFFTMLALTFIQIPLQHYIGVALTHFWSVAALNDWILLTGLPQILVSGLVQEGAKMVPIVAWWWRSGRHIDPKLGLAIGAIAGAAYGIFEGFWVHTNVLASGWHFSLIGTYGFTAITPFWERFFTIGFHTACSSLAGYGLAKGLGWQFYLIATGLHSLLNYAIVLIQKGYLTVNQAEIWVAVVAVVTTVVVLWLRWRKEKEAAPLLLEVPMVPPSVPPETPTGSV